MASPLGPFLANVFMGKVEKTSLQETINDLVFYRRYVDDIFCLTDGTTDTEELVQKFTSAHPSLKFTAETETDNELAFLDVLLHRQEDGSIQRRVFRKKTWTGQCVNFHSFVPLNIKRNLVQGLAARVRRICSPEAIEDELQQLRNTLRENAFIRQFDLSYAGSFFRNGIKLHLRTGTVQEVIYELLQVLKTSRLTRSSLRRPSKTAISKLLAEKNRLNEAYVERPTDDSKSAFYRGRRFVQQRLREMLDGCMAREAEEIQGRLSNHLEEGLLPESQCGFHRNRVTTDMIFAARQLQEKCRTMQTHLYSIYVDPTTAFDTVNHEGLCKIM
nr:unnamed protein product [Spirometra erinaceieuropaei]